MSITNMVNVSLLVGCVLASVACLAIPLDQGAAGAAGNASYGVAQTSTSSAGSGSASSFATGGSTRRVGLVAARAAAVAEGGSSDTSESTTTVADGGASTASTEVDSGGSSATSTEETTGGAVGEAAGAAGDSSSAGSRDIAGSAGTAGSAGMAGAAGAAGAPPAPRIQIGADTASLEAYWTAYTGPYCFTIYSHPYDLCEPVDPTAPDPGTWNWRAKRDTGNATVDTCINQVDALCAGYHGVDACGVDVLPDGTCERPMFEGMCEKFNVESFCAVQCLACALKDDEIYWHFRSRCESANQGIEILKYTCPNYQ